MPELNLTIDLFDSEVIRSDIPVLVDFRAEWCGPCRMLAPVVKQIAEEYRGKLKVCLIDVDDQNELAAKFNVASIPTLLLFRQGEIIATSIGFQTKASLVKMLADNGIGA